jgi:uncharacterized membrane protein YhaH (DUF805 family)
MWSYLFSFRGRINRAKLWLFSLITFGVEFFCLLLQVALTGGQPIDDDGPGDWLSQPRLLILAVLFIGIGLALCWAYLAVTIKRLHDRDRSGWWFLVFYVLPLAALLALASALQALGVDLDGAPANIPLIGCLIVACLFQLWGFVELYLLPGTMGDNRYGADPLAVRQD